MVNYEQVVSMVAELWATNKRLNNAFENTSKELSKKNEIIADLENRLIIAEYATFGYGATPGKQATPFSAKNDRNPSTYPNKEIKEDTKEK